MILHPHHRPATDGICCACCCGAGVRGARAVGCASFLTFLAAILLAVACAGTGDVFYAGWSMGQGAGRQQRRALLGAHAFSRTPTASPQPSAPSPAPSPAPRTPSAGLGRLTLHSLNFCGGLSDDTFCTDFFADKRLPLSAFPGGSSLLAVALPLQCAMAAALALGLLTLARLGAVGCKGSARAGGLQGYCTPARAHAFAALCAASCLGSALLGAWALRSYAAAAGAFFEANKGTLHVEEGWTFQSGWLCGGVGVSFNLAAAVFFLSAAAGARRDLRREAAEAAGGAGAAGGSGGGGGASGEQQLPWGPVAAAPAPQVGAFYPPPPPPQQQHYAYAPVDGWYKPPAF